MQVLEQAGCDYHASRAFRHVPRVIDTLGGMQFGQELLSLLADLCDADHCTVFKITEKSPCEVIAVSRDGTDTAHRQSSLYVNGSFWRYDKPMARAMRSVGACGTTIDMSDVGRLPDREFRDRIYSRAHIRDRILLCGGAGDLFIGISILRADRAAPINPTSQRTLSELNALSDTLISLVGKHVSLLDAASGLSLALTSLTEIEHALEKSSVVFPKRELQVCARILYGISATGIALDLDIGEETVATYRKRAYHRLGIGTQRELLVWYLREWGMSKTLQYGTAGTPPKMLY